MNHVSAYLYDSLASKYRPTSSKQGRASTSIRQYLLILLWQAATLIHNPYPAVLLKFPDHHVI